MRPVSASDLPPVIQGGMGVGVSSWQLARTVAAEGGLGVVSGVAPDLLLARWLQDGDPAGHVRQAMSAYPDQEVVARTLRRYYRPDGREPGTAYRPIPRLDHHQRIEAVRLAALGTYVQVRLAKSGHHGPIGINLLEKIQLWTPAVLLGAMLADIDVVLVGAGLPTHLPRLLDGLANGEQVTLPLDVADSEPGESFSVTLDPNEVVPGIGESLRRPVFLAIVSSHILGSYLARDEVTRPDGLVVEGPTAGGHNAPPRRMALDDNGEPIYGPRDLVDLDKLRAVGLPFWLAGGQAGPERLAAALAEGAQGVQVGTVFALSNESGLTEPLRRALVGGLRSGNAHVRTDPVASPTGFPFKVVELPDTVATPEVYQARERNCDLGYLRTPYRRTDGSIGQRCPAEPVDAYVRKGGTAEDSIGRVCLCNGLTASAGLPQHRRDGTDEPPLLTLGEDLESVQTLLERHPDGWSATDVMQWLLADVALAT
jgi:NAD(P)H-dependent flavin oxidoreductase YrpB (nitropropane dioxygenase family)